MSSDFQFKYFTIKQRVNSQKVGTDSMLLGAWSFGKFKNILDIGTGTGILALMSAQKNPNATVTAIEPDADSYEEALTNFSNSIFSERIQSQLISLQNFIPKNKFDLIISNPPYFENSTLSNDDSRNRVRHTGSLPVSHLYFHASKLLEPDGVFNLIIPYELESIHLNEAEKNGLFPNQILRTKREDNQYKRTLFSFSFSKKDIREETIIVKFSNNKYSNDYISLTREFYLKDLSKE